MFYRDLNTFTLEDISETVELYCLENGDSNFSQKDKKIISDLLDKRFSSITIKELVSLLNKIGYDIALDYIG